jgi:GH15 family glucan-1,4-alpha-glucosidase
VCTCWLIDYLVLSGKREEGSKLLNRLIYYANDLGLLAEEVDPASGNLLGNFPLGFSHLGITRSILNIAGSKNQAG